MSITSKTESLEEAVKYLSNLNLPMGSRNTFSSNAFKYYDKDIAYE